ncbi:MAG: DUF3638 domain-containing protein [Chlamydiales bacterium]|nr:DUF3638 domain-containing protein [Chlamydiales bacterium]
MASPKPPGDRDVFFDVPPLTQEKRGASAMRPASSPPEGGSSVAHLAARVKKAPPVKTALHPMEESEGLPPFQPSKEPPLVLAKTPREAEASFALFLQDFLEATTKGLYYTTSSQIAHIIHALETMGEKGLFLDQLKDSYKVAVWFEEAITYMQSEPLSKEKALLARKQLKESILLILKEKGSVIIPAGIQQDGGSAHLIPIVLELKDDTVNGYLLNRGKGLCYHSFIMHPGNLKQQFGSRMDLQSTSLQQLESSDFFDLMLALILPFEGFTTAAQFYEILVPSWPAKAQLKKSLKEARQAQRGSTCVVKTYLTLMTDTLPKESAVNFKLTSAIILVRNLVTFSDLSTLNLYCLKETLEKQFRYILKHKIHIKPHLFEEALEVFLAFDAKLDSLLQIRENVVRKFSKCLQRGKVSANTPVTFSCHDYSPQLKEVKTLASFPSEDPQECIAQFRHLMTENRSPHLQRLVGISRLILGKNDLQLAYEELIRLCSEAPQLHDFSIKNIFPADAATDAAFLLMQIQKSQIMEALSTPIIGKQRYEIFEWVRALPSPQHKVWKKFASDEMLYILEEAMGAILQEQSHDERAALSPPSIALCYKIVAIQLMIAHKSSGLETLVPYYTRYLAEAQKHFLPKLTFTNSDDQRILEQSLAALEALPQSNFECQFEVAGLLLEEKFTSEEELYDHPELGYCYRTFLANRIEFAHYYRGCLPYKAVIQMWQEQTHPLTSSPHRYLAGFKSLRHSFWTLVALTQLSADWKYSSDIVNFCEVDAGNAIPEIEISVAKLKRCHKEISAPENALAPLSAEERKLLFQLSKKQRTHQTENRQLLLQQGWVGEFSLSALDIQELVALGISSPEHLALTLDYFHRHLEKLSRPFFQVLFLKYIVHTFNTAQEERLYLDFYTRALDSTLSKGELEIHLFLLYTLAHGHTYRGCTPRYTLLKDSIERLKDSTDPRVCYHMIAMAPYLTKDVDLLSILALFYDRLREHPNPSRVIEEDHRHGFFTLQKLRKGEAPWPENHLPMHFVLSKKCPAKSNLRAKRVSQSGYEFRFKGRDYAMEEENGELKLYQRFPKVQEGWFRNVNLSFSEETAPFQYLLSECSFWSKGKDFAIAVHHKSGETIAIIEKGVVRKPNSSWTLFTDWKKLKNVWPPFLNIAPNAIDYLTWKDESGQLKAFEFPRLNLHFVYDQGWMCLEYPGYFIMDAEKRRFPHALFLQNSAGKSLFLLRHRTFRERSFSTIYPQSIEIENDKPELYAYRLNEWKEVVIPADSFKQVYLFYSAFIVRDFKLVERILTNMQEDDEMWTPEACMLFEELSISPSIPAEYALYIRSLLIKSRLGGGLSKNEKLRLLRCYFLGYLPLLNHSWHYRLSRTEELQILKLTPSEEENIFFFSSGKVRLAQIEGRLPLLTPVDTARTPPDHTHTRGVPSVDRALVTKHYQEQVKAIETPHLVVDFFNPGKNFYLNFLYYYKILRHYPLSDPLYIELNKFLLWSRYSIDAECLACHEKLFCLSSSSKRETFPPLEAFLKSEESFFTHFIQLPHTTRYEPCDTFLKNLEGGKIPFLSRELGRGPTAMLARTLPPQSLEFQTKPQWPKSDELLSLLRTHEAVVDYNPNKEREALNGLARMLPRPQNHAETLECERLITGVTQLKQMLPKFALNTEKRQNSYQLLKRRKEQSSELAESARQEAEALARHYTEDVYLEAYGGMHTKLTIEELIIAFTSKDSERILRANPTLDAEQLSKLYQIVCLHLFYKTEQLHIERLMHLLEIQNDSTFIEELTHERAYNPENNFFLLTFEYFARIRLRPQQIDALHAMERASSPHIEWEGPTGIGKSSVIIPLWLYIKSLVEKQIAVITTPASLLQEMRENLRHRLGTAFETQVITIEFDREQANTLPYLQRIVARLELAQRQNKVLLLSVETLHALFSLKYRELLYDKLGNGRENQALIDEMLKIRIILQDLMTNAVDESTVCLENERCNDYSVGRPIQLEKARIEGVSVFYEILLQDPSINAKWRFPFSFNKVEGQRLPTIESYESELLPNLARCFCRYFFEDQEHQQIVAHLCGETSDEAKALYSKLDEAQLFRYALVREFLTIHFKRTLFARLHDRYRVEDQEIAARPLRDGALMAKSEFSSANDLIAFTLQAHLLQPLQPRRIEQFQLDIQKDLDSLTESELASCPRAEWAKRFGLPCLRDLVAMRPELLCEQIEMQSLIKFHFIVVQLLPQLYVSKHKISATSFELVRHHRKKMLSMSGTIDPTQLPPSVEVIANPSAVVHNLLALSKQGEICTLLKPDKVDEQLRSLISSHPFSSVIVDAAGLFSSLSMEEIGQAILEAQHTYQAVLLFDQEGREYVYAEGKVLEKEYASIPDNQIFIFIPKWKSVGTDVKEMSPQAWGIVTLDQECRFTPVAQAVGRFRNLGRGQGMIFAFLAEEQSIIGRDFPAILAHLIQNEAQHKSASFVQTLRLYLKDLIMEACEKMLHAPEQSFSPIAWLGLSPKPLTKKERFAAIEGIVMETTFQSPLNTLDATILSIPREEFVKVLLRQMVEPLKKRPEFRSVDFQSIEKNFCTFARKQEELLPEQVRLHDLDNRISTSESVKEVVEVKVTESESTSASARQLDGEMRGCIFTPIAPQSWDGNCEKVCKGKPFLTLFNLRCHASPNLNLISERGIAEGRLRKRPYFIFITAKPPYQIVFLDLHDAHIAREYLKKKGKKGTLLNSLGVVEGLPFDLNPQRNPANIPICILHKLLAANPKLTSEERLFLKELGAQEKEVCSLLLKELASYWPHLHLAFKEIYDLLKK